MPPEIYHLIKNHCFKPWNDLICLFPSCSVKSPSSLPTLMRVRPQGLSWRLLTSACPTDVAFLGRDPAAVVLSVINIPLSHLPPPSRGKWQSPLTGMWAREREEHRFLLCTPREDAYWLTPKLITASVTTAYSAGLLLLFLPLAVI